MQSTLVLLAAAFLRIPARRMRALALGDDAALRDWVAGESAWRLAQARRDARLAVARLAALDARVVTLRDPDFPQGLRDLRDPPAFLTVRGSLPGHSGPCGTAIVGTRTPDFAACEFARALAMRVPAPIVSGLALGIDTAAHEGALATGAVTIAYVGNGLGATYPPQNAALEEQILAAGGCIASELLPDEPAMRWSLVRRDRLQTAHAARIVLVQSELAGGAMHAMRSAAELGRPRYALDVHDRAAFEGNQRAIADGATPLPDDAERAARLLASAGA